MKSWKTTLGGLLCALGPMLTPVLPPEWQWVSVTLVGVGGLLIGVNARDNKVSTEEARKN